MRVFKRVLLFVSALMIATSVHAASTIDKPSPEDVAEATAFVRELADATITSLSDATLNDEEQRGQFKELIDRGFASEYIAKVVLGRYWRKLPVNQRPEYLTLFKAFMLESLMSRMGIFNDEYLDITGHDFTKKGDIFIMSQVVMTTQAFDVDWRVRRFGGEFKIIDVRLEGISMVITSHEEVTSIAFSEGIEGLLETLRARSRPPSIEPLANSTFQN